MPIRNRALRLVSIYGFFGLITFVFTSWALLFAPAPLESLRVADRDADPSRGEGPGFLALMRTHGPGSQHFESMCATTRQCYCFASEENPEPWLDNVTPEAFAPAFARDALLPWSRNPSVWPTGDFAEHRSVLVCGWPLPALWCEPKYDHWTFDAQFQRGGILFFNRTLPFRPAWLPLGVNVAAHSVICFGVFSALRTVTRRARRRLPPSPHTERASE